jgi:hypothetical protein
MYTWGALDRSHRAAGYELLSGCFAAIAYVTEVIGEIAIVTYHANSPMLAGELRHSLWRGCLDHFLSTKLFAVLM